MPTRPDPSSNPLLELPRLGQSVWLDYIRRRMLDDGELARLAGEDGVSGVTSNPAIFEKAIATGDEYTAQILEVAPGAGGDAKRIFEALAVEDIRRAADVLAGVHEASGGADGFVSLEVAPALARDAEGTVAEARRLWAEVGRPNLMIKVPGTPECMPAVRELLEAGVNVNVTLLFARSAYAAVAEAHLSALEARAARGEAVDGVASVASFFVSRIDTLLDRRLEERESAATTPAERALARRLRGRVAIANAKLAYRHYRELVASQRWRRLAGAGARPQRLLWASTSTKNPAYRDTLYVEELIGPDTVNTMPPETLEAFRDHGVAQVTLDRDFEGAERDLADLADLGLSLDAATAELLEDGIRKFAEPFEKLLGVVAARARSLAGERA
ncbi:MAG: transaldolase [Thermoanaerobaculia bacterium]|nr:MAG: transaldolase [Thermoanaerobaculia bacterium]